MKKTLLFVALALFSLCSCSRSKLIVPVEGGRIQGATEAEGVAVFKGIPYAAPPVGELRWQDPQPVIPWEGVRKADSFGPIAMQKSPDSSSMYYKEFYSTGLPEMSEDCLYLNVWAPEGSVGDTRAKLPVAMWIHGGAFSGGYGHEITMDGTEWARRGVILVTINYRLGILGFLAHPELSKEQGGLSGNYGLKDQIAALKWIHENIEGFGGDPDNNTVMGQSAGGMSVRCLAVCPESKPLMAKAIIQSAGGLLPKKPLPKSWMADKYGKILMDGAGYTSLQEMRVAGYEEIFERVSPHLSSVVASIMTEGADIMDAMILWPKVDGKTLSEDFDSAVYDDSVADIPYMIGSVTDDGEVLGGAGIPRFCVERSARSSKGSYAYYFSRELPGDESGAFHSSELWYMFGTLDRSWRPFTEADHALSEKMLDAWTSFCKTGTPGWAPCTEDNPYIETLDTN